MTSKRITLFLVLLVTTVSTRTPGQQIEVKSQGIVRVDKAGRAGEFQLSLDFSLPSVPERATITNAVLILDQTFQIEGSGEMPKGLTNKTQEPLMLSVYGFSKSSAQAGSEWVSFTSNRSARVSSRTLIPSQAIQEERKAKRWEKQAIEFSVADFVRKQVKQQSSSVVFVVTKAGSGDQGVKTNDVECDVTKLTGRLVISYVQEPQLPPWVKKK